MALLTEMNQTQNTTFLIVTHDANIASRCQRTITMSDGSILTDAASSRAEEE
jgi:ABC-type lipoprotein export system ATPase subunit